jgi:hypothetical protein
VTGTVAIALLLVVFVGTFSVSLDEYAKGAVRTAVDDGAQAGAVAGGSIPVCQLEAQRVLTSLLRGMMGREVRVICTDAGADLLAQGSGRLPTLVPGLPAVYISVTGESVIQTDPEQ